MSAQVQSSWKVLDNNNATSNRRSERGKRSQQAKSEEVLVDSVKSEANDTKTLSNANEKQSEASAVEMAETENNAETNKADSSANARKTRATLSRRKQTVSKRALRKAGEINGDEQTKTPAEELAESKQTVHKSSEQDANRSETNPINSTTAAAAATAATAETTDHSNNNNAAAAAAAAAASATVNVWEARRQQQQQQVKKSDSSSSSQPTKFISNSAYRPPKVLPSIVQPAKQLNVEPPKAVIKEQVSIAATSIPTTSPSRLGASGYRPPHQRGDAAIVKPPEDSEEYSRRERIGKANPRERERDRERGDKDGPVAKSSGPERTLTREDMGKGYERKPRPQQGQEDDDRRSNDKKLEGESPRDYGNQRKGYSRNRRKEDSWTHSNSRSNANGTDDTHPENTTTHKKENYFSKRGDANTMIRSQSLQTESRLTRSAVQSSAGTLTKTYSAPREQLIHAVKLHGSIEQKDEKILKIKQQTKEKAKVQNVNAATAVMVGGFQPILSSAEDALRTTFDGNEDITRENAELVKQELKTSLNPLGAEFAPQQHIPDLNTSLDQGQFVMDQSVDVMQPAQSMVGMYPAYDEHIPNESDHMRDPNMHLSWSFHPSDPSIYAQDIGGDVGYDMGHYPAFGVDGGIGGGAGGPTNATSLSGNASAGGPPSQSPEQMPASHTLNEAYNTQSTATMAPQPQNFAASSGVDASTSLQVSSDGQQAAHESAAQNSQIFTGNDYTVNNSGVIGSDGLNYASQPFYPQGYVDPNSMWGPGVDNVQNYLAWQMHPQQQQQQQQHQQRMNQHGGHKSQYPRRKRFQHDHRQHRGPKQHRFGDSERGGAYVNSHPHPHPHPHPHSHHHHQNHDGQKKMKHPKKKIGKKGNFGNYRTKDHGFGSQNNASNEAEANGNGQNVAMQQHSGVSNGQNANQWQNYSTEYDGGYHEARLNGQQDLTEREDTKEDGSIAVPKQFETLTLSGWFVVIEPLSPQHLDKFQNQLFATSPVSLKTFRLEIPSSPVRSAWVNRVQWGQLTEYLSQANLEHVVITSHLQNKSDEFNHQDFQDLEPVAKLVSTLKCKCLILERAPCKITPEYIQSLSDHIEELKLLCPSIQWNVDLVRALNPKLSCLGLICPNTIAIDQFLDTLGDKTQRLCLCNDDSSPRKLSPHDVSELFQRVLSLELDRSLLTEIHPTPKTTTTKINELIIRLKDEVPEKDFYEKHSLPKSVTKFEVCPVDRSFMMKRWNGTVVHEDSKLQRVQHAELEHDRIKREPTQEDNKTTLNAQDQQNHGQAYSNDGRKMSFKEKLKSSQKNIKKNPLRIEGQTL